MSENALQPATPDADRARLAALELEIGERDREATRLKRELLALQTRYLDDIGGLYAKLNELETAIADEEIALGLRPPPDPDDDSEDGDKDGRPGAEEIGAAAGCGHRTAPSADLKRIFRQLARAIHPDLADEIERGPARYRRHSLMAEANRAYAERDEDRLRLILSRWERGDAHGENDVGSVPSRIAALEERRLAMDAELADLKTSAIWRLNAKMEEARLQGWDLFAEMLREVDREIRRATARLARLRKQRASSSAPIP